VILNAPNVALETVKRGETDRQQGLTVILRLIEKRGGHACAKLVVSGLRVSKAEAVNLLEDHIHFIEIDRDDLNIGSSMSVEMRGFEIKTLKLYIEH
jgi:alpha-mannosidase